MELIDIPTEQTTAASDAVLALLGLGCAVYLCRRGRRDPWRAGVWSLAIGLLALAAGLGAVAHGFKISPETRHLLWQPINLALGFSVALFVVGVVLDVWGRKAAWPVLPVMIATALAFYLLTVIVPGSFLLFAIFELLAMGFAAAAYGWMALRHRRTDSALVTVGISLSLLAAAIQTQHEISITILWELDHNGVYHLVQILGLLVLTAGLRAGFPRPPTGPVPTAASRAACTGRRPRLF